MKTGKISRLGSYSENGEQFGGDFVKAEYLKGVISGAMENHLPEEWIKFLLSFQ